MSHSKSFAKKFGSTTRPTLVLKPSRIHRVGLLFLSCILVVAVLNSRLSEYLYLLGPLILYYFYDHDRRHFGPLAVRRLKQEGTDFWTLNEDPFYQLLPSSSVRRYWAVLYFKRRDEAWWKRARVVAIFPDSLPADAFRRLRVALRSFRA